MTPRSASFRMAEALVGGDLLAHIARLHTEAGTWEEVSRRLLVDHGVRVSGQTLRRWAAQIGTEADKAAS